MATKKATKAAVMPASKDETFVSLTMSKSAGDSDAVAVEDKLHALYNIQQLDTRIDKIYLLRGELPLEVKDIEDEIEGLKTRLANIQAEVDAAQNQIAVNRQKIVDAQKAIEKYTAQQEKVKNNREYESIGKELEFQDLEVTAANKHIKDDQIFCEERAKVIEDTKTRLSLREEDLAAKRAELDTIIEETSKDEEKLLAEREVLVAKVDQRMLTAYERVRNSTRNKLAVVTVQRDACGGCFNKIPSQRQLDINSSKKIIVCEYCGRILVSSSFAKESSDNR